MRSEEQQRAMIDKPTIIVSSLGRTGTKFFYTLFKEILPQGTAFHEPDTFHIGRGNGIRRLVEQTRAAGVYNMFVRKALGRWGVVRLSHARVEGRLDYDEAVRRVLSQRADFVPCQPGTLYMESNLGYYGLLDVVKDVYAHHRAIYIIRDGRDWVRSKMNRAQMYNRQGVRGYFAHKWPTASAVAGDPYHDVWETMSRFERVCWSWSKLNGYALEAMRSNPDARLYLFEEIFHAEDRYETLAELVAFATDFEGRRAPSAAALDGWLDRRVNVSQDSFPHWEDWSAEQKRQFHAICGPLMDELGYDDRRQA
jgi:hypothetical protein